MRNKKIQLIILEVLGVLLGLLYISPFYIIIINSFKSKKEFLLNTLSWPNELLLDNYLKAMDKMGFLTAFKNSLIVTVLSLLLIVILSSMAAWMLARTKSKLSNVIFYSFVAAMLIPFQSVMLPLVDLFGVNKLNLINTHFGIIFMYVGFGASLSVFLFHGFVKSVPISLEEAATIDGCNKLQLYWKIVFPLLKSISVTVAILNGMWIWNDFLLPSLVLQKKELRTLPLSTKYFFGAYQADWTLAMAGLVLAIIPIIIFYLLAQKQIIKGVLAGSIK
ncbi:carbohydrate ABC transporter permease [Vallitalea okinawensis]|uniref:carbohydrate ABC transporter permease n=1 Tax=Vallitalea okinawensis TaxID=2078660 RepID=UPI000CFD3179|nr:carbohydrate ABC transporter permease [Vallitalea okinawensis]